MSTSRARGGTGSSAGTTRQFPVGRRGRYVPVVDAGCGCRPRRPRLLLGLPSFSFLKPSQRLGGNNKAGQRSGAGQQYSYAPTTSTASFSSSSAATHSTGYSSAYSSDYYYHHPALVVYGAAATTTKQQQDPPVPKQATKAASPTRVPAPAGDKKKQVKAKKKKNRYEKVMGPAAEEDGAAVGVAVEKESSDPRADFRDSMVQMVVEMGLCDWDGLRGMLRRLLALNAPRHHAAILTAFAEVCTQLAGAAAVAVPPQPSPPAYQYRRC